MFFIFLSDHRNITFYLKKFIWASQFFMPLWNRHASHHWNKKHSDLKVTVYLSLACDADHQTMAYNYFDRVVNFKDRYDLPCTGNVFNSPQQIHQSTKTIFNCWWYQDWVFWRSLIIMAFCVTFCAIGKFGQ